MIPGTLCIQAFQRLRSCPSLARATALWSLFCACWERFSSGCCACPWPCGFDTEALLSAKDSILELRGSLSCLLCCWNFILGKFLSFLGDGAWAAFAPAWSRALFCSSGFQEWVWGMRIPNQGNYHYMSKMGAIRPSSHIFFFFL